MCGCLSWEYVALRAIKAGKEAQVTNPRASHDTIQKTKRQWKHLQGAPARCRAYDIHAVFNPLPTQMKMRYREYGVNPRGHLTLMLTLSTL